MGVQSPHAKKLAKSEIWLTPIENATMSLRFISCLQRDDEDVDENANV